MKRVLFLCAVLLINIGSAEATLRICNGKLRAFVESFSSGSTAHLVAISNCPTACGFDQRAYIEFEDKELLAYAISATLDGGDYSIAFEDSALPKGSVVHTSIACKVRSIWK